MKNLNKRQNTVFEKYPYLKNIIKTKSDWIDYFYFKKQFENEQLDIHEEAKNFLQLIIDSIIKQYENIDHDLLNKVGEEHPVFLMFHTAPDFIGHYMLDYWIESLYEDYLYVKENKE